jgi:hypothetical protein
MSKPKMTLEEFDRLEREWQARHYAAVWDTPPVTNYLVKTKENAMCEDPAFYYKRRIEEDLRAGKELTPFLREAIDIWLAQPMPPPFKIGSRVNIGKSSHNPGTVIGTYGTKVWVVWDIGTGPQTYEQTGLVKSNG